MALAAVDTSHGGEVFSALFFMVFRYSLVLLLYSSKDPTSLLVDDVLIFFRTGEPVVTNDREDNFYVCWTLLLSRYLQCVFSQSPGMILRFFHLFLIHGV